MYDDKIKEEIIKIKDLNYFFNVINNLPKPQKKVNKTEQNGEKITVFFTVNDNYSCYLAVTGASILYNTNSFIQFYILSDGITEQNKKLITETFSGITDNFSIKFLECNTKEYFKGVTMPRLSHISLNTCNRLVFPMLAPDVDRAIYLDVDVILLDDIKKLWDEDLEGNFYGAVPNYVSKNKSVDYFKTQANIPLNADYNYFNNGVTLIDYKKWREIEGSSQNIAETLIELTKKTPYKTTIDELVMNNYVYNHNGYKHLPHKYNVNPYYSYKWLSDNKRTLNQDEMQELREYESYIKKYNYEKFIPIDGKPVIRHFYGVDKPWKCYTQRWFTMPYTPYFNDYWFYAQMTPYFEDIKQGYISLQMYTAPADKPETAVVPEVQKPAQAETPFYKNSLQKIFSVKNNVSNSKKYKIITVAGVKIKLKQNQ